VTESRPRTRATVSVKVARRPSRPRPSGWPRPH
jgi:hypothetical protein